MFDYWHKNVPEPFNPDYKPHAQGIWDKVVDDLEDIEDREGVVWSREKRARERRELYDNRMKEWEQKNK